MTKPRDRTCIICKHLSLTQEDPGYSEMTPGNNFAMSCGKNHWELDVRNDYENDFRRKLLMAVSCPDFLEIEVKPRKKELSSKEPGESQVIYKLVSENLTNVGGRMGTETTSINWTKYFKNLENAFEYAVQDCDKSTISWKKVKRGHSSEDLGFVMYHVSPVELEDAP